MNNPTDDDDLWQTLSKIISSDEEDRDIINQQVVNAVLIGCTDQPLQGLHYRDVAQRMSSILPLWTTGKAAEWKPVVETAAQEFIDVQIKLEALLNRDARQDRDNAKEELEKKNALIRKLIDLAPAKQRKRMTLKEAEASARRNRKYLQHIDNKTKWAEKIGCSEETVGKLLAWKDAQKKLKAASKDKRPATMDPNIMAETLPDNSDIENLTEKRLRWIDGLPPELQETAKELRDDPDSDS